MLGRDACLAADLRLLLLMKSKNLLFLALIVTMYDDYDYDLDGVDYLL